MHRIIKILVWGSLKFNKLNQANIKLQNELIKISLIDVI